MRTTTDRERPGDEGFTLVELLTVTLILGILAAIAIPLMVHNREKAYRASMKADLRSAVLAQMAWNSEHASYTDAVDDLAVEGYRNSQGVSPVHLKVVGTAGYVACVKHSAATDWLVYDSATGTMASSDSDCAA
jgi:prepilin-type N-terminal cleavage/methylation domain-containing protein